MKKRVEIIEIFGCPTSNVHKRLEAFEPTRVKIDRYKRHRADRYIVGLLQSRLTWRQAKKRLEELSPYWGEVIYELVEVKRVKGGKP